MSFSGFPTTLRLTASSDYDAVFAGPSVRVRSGSFTALAKANGLFHPRLGLITAKRNVRLAHDRNRIRRLIRESFRHNRERLPEFDVIVMAQKGAADLENPQVFQHLLRIWEKLACHRSTEPERSFEGQ